MIIPASRNDYTAGFADGYRQGKKDVERKKGRWIKKEERVYYWYECSECGAKPLWNEWRTDRCFSAFCPNCGARMEE